MVYTDGSVYEGKWENDVRNGDNCYFRNAVNGSKYVGSFVNDVI